MGNLTKIVLNFFFLVSLLCGCKDDVSSRKLVAQKKLDVFEDYRGDSMKVVFDLLPGEQCSIGKKETAKMFSYIEVFCHEKGHGWIVLGEGYKIIEDNAVQ